MQLPITKNIPLIENLMLISSGATQSDANPKLSDAEQKILHENIEKISTLESDHAIIMNGTDLMEKAARRGEKSCVIMRTEYQTPKAKLVFDFYTKEGYGPLFIQDGGWLNLVVNWP